jgi:hypothetical protein
MDSETLAWDREQITELLEMVRDDAEHLEDYRARGDEAAVRRVEEKLAFIAYLRHLAESAERQHHAEPPGVPGAGEIEPELG